MSDSTFITGVATGGKTFVDKTMSQFMANYSENEQDSIMIAPTTEQAYDELIQASGESSKKEKGPHAMMAEMLNDAGYDAAVFVGAQTKMGEETNNFNESSIIGIRPEPAYRSYELTGQDFDKNEGSKELTEPIKLGE